MRRLSAVSICSCIAVFSACGDADQSTLDPNYLALSGQAPPAKMPPSSGIPGKTPIDAVGSPPEVMKPSTPEPNACEPAGGGACSAPPAEEDEASTSGGAPLHPPESSDGKTPSGSGEHGADDGGTAENGDPAGQGGTGAAGSSSADDGGAGGAPPTGAGGDASGGVGAAPSKPEPEPEPEPQALPDLILDGAYLMSTVKQDFIDASADMCLFNEGCVTGFGERRIIRFGTRSANVGTADAYVGVPELGNPNWEFDECHQHFHFEGYASYDLVDPGTGDVLPIGNKNGFCLRDLDVWSSGASCANYDCNNQGIAVGCADVYTPDLPCQWVDITDVTPGIYDLVVTVNSAETITELTRDNNTASVRIEILPETIHLVP